MADNSNWKYLDDIVSLLWLGGISIALIGSVVTLLYLVATGEIAVTGSIPVEMVIRTIVAPIVLIMTAMAILTTFGKRRVQTFFDMIRDNRDLADDAADSIDDE